MRVHRWKSVVFQLVSYNRHQFLHAGFIVCPVTDNLQGNKTESMNEKILTTCCSQIQSTPFIADTIGTEFISVKLSVIYFCQGLSCCPYYRGVHNSQVFARRELTVQQSCTLITILHTFRSIREQRLFKQQGI